MINVAESFKSNINEIRIYSFSNKNEIDFKSFLTEYNDQYSTNWNSQEIYGRMDPIHTYKNTTRKITLGFDVPNFDIEEAKNNAIKADLLIKALYPVYETNESLGTAILSSPPLFKIKFANLITNVSYAVDGGSDVSAKDGGLMGWIDGYSFKPELDSGFFFDESKQMIFPKLFKVNFIFNVIHEHPLGNMNRSDNIRITRLQNGSESFSHQYDSRVAPRKRPVRGPPTVEETPPVEPPKTASQEGRRMIGLVSVPQGSKGSAFVDVSTPEQQRHYLDSMKNSQNSDPNS